MAEEKKQIEPKKKKPQTNNSFGGMKMWAALMGVYILSFVIIGYVAFMPMEFNDPGNTVRKYLVLLHKNQEAT
ncbi:MAG: hypothetical protein GY950_31045, partial [bacterium]|nr:hypothetical protein [bacterium]